MKAMTKISPEMVALLEDLYCKTAGEFNDYSRTEDDYTTDSVPAVQKFLIAKGLTPKFETVRMTAPKFVVVEKCAKLEEGDKIEFNGKLLEFTGYRGLIGEAAIAAGLARKVVYTTNFKSHADEFIVEMTNFKL